MSERDTVFVGRDFDVVLEVAAHYAADASGLLCVRHEDESSDSFIVMNGRIRAERFSEQVDAVLNDTSASIVDRRSVDLDGRACLVIRQRDEEMTHLVLLVPLPAQGEGLLVRGCAPLGRADLAASIEQMVLSTRVRSIPRRSKPEVERSFDAASIRAATLGELQRAGVSRRAISPPAGASRTSANR